MSTRLNRRGFLAHSAMVSAGAAVAAGAADGGPWPAVPEAKVTFGSKGSMPAGRIGTLTVSRLGQEPL